MWQFIWYSSGLSLSYLTEISKLCYSNYQTTPNRKFPNHFVPATNQLQMMFSPPVQQPSQALFCVPHNLTFFIVPHSIALAIISYIKCNLQKIFTFLVFKRSTLKKDVSFQKKSLFWLAHHFNINFVSSIIDYVMFQIPKEFFLPNIHYKSYCRPLSFCHFRIFLPQKNRNVSQNWQKSINTHSCWRSMC
jgi:hypothetical protein